VDANEVDPFAAVQERSVVRDAETERMVSDILAAVRSRGDSALLEFARKFDAPDQRELVTTRDQIEQAQIEERFDKAIELAAAQINMFHTGQFLVLTAGMARTDSRFPIQQSWQGGERPSYSWDSRRATERIDALSEPFPVGSRGQRYLPLSRVGVYVPGGNAIYPSSVLMNAIPAQVAGVREVIVASPARGDGEHPETIRVAMRYAGVSTGIRIGGAAAIGAMAFGTESIPRVDKIVGPGNRWVNEAKRQVWGEVGLDGYAGPSEVCVVVDESANPAFAAADLLTQVEHAPDNAGFLIATSHDVLQSVLRQVEVQLLGAPREATMRRALKENSMAIVAFSGMEAIDLINVIAPEHLTLSVKEPHRWLEHIVNAGCVLLGDWTPESAGDYCLGPSHTLPTSGAARWQGPVNVLDFLKVQSVSNLDRETLEFWNPVIEAFGEMEGFPAHARGASIRFE
jgi:histidinol dehydrogenase